jgi:hypothetical protein
MKTVGLGCVALLLACGGSGGADLPDGSTDSGTDGTTTNDTGTSDTGKNDTGSDAANDTGAGDGGDGGDGATFTPLDVLGLVLWLEADVTSSITLVTLDAGPQRVSEWADQTSHHNNANGNPSLPTRDPSVTASAINSLPAVHFNQGTNTIGSSGQMLTIAENTDTSLDWGTGDFFVAIVGDFDNAVTNGPNLGVGNFFSKSSAYGPSLSYTGVLFFGNVPVLLSNANPDVGLLFGTGSNTGDYVTTTTAYNTGSPHLFVMRRRGAQIDLFVDGTNVATSTSSGVNVTNGNIVRIGADGDASFVRLDGDIGEMLAVKGVLAMGDEANLDSYLKTKWATP